MPETYINSEGVETTFYYRYDKLIMELYPDDDRIFKILTYTMADRDIAIPLLLEAEFHYRKLKLLE